MDLEKMQKILERKKGERNQINKQITTLKGRGDELDNALSRAEEAQVIIQTVAQQTQQELEYQVSDLVSLALSSVFDEPYEFVVDFEIKRGKTECNLHFDRDGNDVDPLEDSGYGAVDIASFGLRTSLLAITQPNNASILILDEPLKHLKGLEANRRAIQTFKMVSDKLGIQIITIPDEKAPMAEIEKGADVVFSIGMEKGISKITSIKMEE